MAGNIYKLLVNWSISELMHSVKAKYMVVEEFLGLFIVVIMKFKTVVCNKRPSLINTSHFKVVLHCSRFARADGATGFLIS